MAATSAGSRRILRVRGTVQGVGFRPFVYRTAVDLGLRGSVWNDAEGVVIEAEGSIPALDELARRIAASPPPRAIIEGLDVEHALARGLEAFSIGASEALS